MLIEWTNSSKIKDESVVANNLIHYFHSDRTIELHINIIFRKSEKSENSRIIYSMMTLFHVVCTDTFPGTLTL